MKQSKRSLTQLVLHEEYLVNAIVSHKGSTDALIERLVKIREELYRRGYIPREVRGCTQSSKSYWW